MNLDPSPMVCLDGTAVRRIREEKKLTQLYVAKVVGVTTDTVSRWENNRYPTIKRENAIRLAEALEAPLADIMQKPDVPEAVPPPRSPFRWPLLVAVALLLVAGGAYFFLPRTAVPIAGLRAERLLPPYAAPGSIVPVRVRLETEGARGFILREHFPAGWKLIEASPPASSLDNEEGVARWIVKGGQLRQVISYLIRVDPEAAAGGERSFHGDIVASPDGTRPVAVAGDRAVRVAPWLWADLDGDGSIDDSEMLQASDTFEEMEGVHLDWRLLESIWDAGSYRWHAAEKEFRPVRPPG